MRDLNELYYCKAVLLPAHKTKVGCNNNNGFPHNSGKNHHMISQKLTNINKNASRF